MVQRSAWVVLGSLLGGLSAVSCGSGTPSPLAAASTAHPAAPRLVEEEHLADMRQITFGGENAEAYWSFGGKELILQSRPATAGCDRIFRMKVADDRPSLTPVSSGKGATTCSYFLPGDQDVIFASTHLGGDACPPRPDHSQGYVWALYDSYDIFRAKADGSNVVRLTDTPGYDAEGTVCAKDGSIVFTSVRDGDIDLYRMDADGKNVKRLTSTPGYDGGAFFNADCTKIVWRASRPKPGKEFDDYKRLLDQRLVRPTKLELYVANADGSEPMQITYLDAASFGPFWHPSQNRILFASNYGDPKGREFDIWAVDVNGTNLERVTFAKGFDGFPMFSPDGQYLAFASNRATAPGSHDTNVFVARWVDAAPKRAAESPADRILADVRWLADPVREGRGVGTEGLAKSGEYLEKRYRELGLAPAGDNGGYRQLFPVTTAIKGYTVLEMGKTSVAPDAMTAMASSAAGEVKGELVLAGYGISDKDLGVDDYAKVDVKNKIVVVRRFVPQHEQFEGHDAERRFGGLDYKAWIAREKGAKALVIVDTPAPPKDAPKDWKMPDEAPFPMPHHRGYGDAGIPVVIVKRAVMSDQLDKLSKKQKVQASLKVTLERTTKDAFNVLARLGAGAPEAARLPGVVVLGAHYDHLGMGGRDSLAPGQSEPHVGADDNASGTAALLEVARALASHRSELKRDVVFASFSGEEAGVLGSTHYTRTPSGGLAMKDVVAMINMDMVGRMRENRTTVLGAATAGEWDDLVKPACAAARIECTTSGDGYGPSDQTSFYATGVPVLHFFTGSHSDYHKPSDTADKINAAGAAQIAEVVADLAGSVGKREGHLSFRKVPAPLPQGDTRSFNASLGTIPDYAGPPNGQKGVLLAGVRPGGAAETAGLKRGDILIRLGKHEIGSVEDLMYVLNSSKPGERVTATALRDGKEVSLDVTFAESRRPR